MLRMSGFACVECGSTLSHTARSTRCPACNCSLTIRLHWLRHRLLKARKAQMQAGCAACAGRAGVPDGGG